MTAWKATIAVEGEVSLDGRLLRPGALTWETPLPLIDYGGSREDGTYEYKIIGTVEYIRRIVGEDGRNLIQATGVRWDEPVGTGGPSVSSVNGEYDVEQMAEHRIRFLHAEIKAVYLGTPIWPDVRFEEE